MTTSDKNALWALFGIALLATATASGSLGWAIQSDAARARLAAERTAAVGDMADAMKVVCAEHPGDRELPRAYACIGGLQMMLATIEIKDKRVENEHAR